MPTALVTGANRGIGLEFVKQLSSQGWTVYGTVRDIRAMPHVDGVKVFKLNSESLVDAHLVAGELQALHVELDVIIANAGIDPSPARLVDLPPAVLQYSYQVNRQGRKFAVLGSLAGGFTRSMGPTCGAYDFSKIGVNFLVRKLQAEHPEYTVMALNPGCLVTEMGVTGTLWRSGDLAGRLQPSETVPSMIRVLKSTDKELGGRLIDWDGEILDF